MYYESGEFAMVGDRIKDRSERLGTVREVHEATGIIIIKWDRGMVGIQYPYSGEFALVSRASERDQNKKRQHSSIESAIREQAEGTAVNEEIVAGDFVLMNMLGAITIGLVHKVEDGQAYVWWHSHDKSNGRPQTIEQRHPLLALSVAEVASDIPASMILLRKEKFASKAFHREPGEN